MTHDQQAVEDPEVVADEDLDDVRLVSDRADAHGVHAGLFSSSVAARRLKIVVACPGVGRERRGFETFAEEFSRAFRDDPQLEVTLARSAGPLEPGRLRVPSAARRGRAARVVGRALRRDALWAEQASYSAVLAARLPILRPDVVYVSE